jgi:ectoine hydroxylase-related dioxygenase (phytanoyl-CoA dioxygenase family)
MPGHPSMRPDAGAIADLVTEADIRAYRKDGVVCLRNLIDEKWIALLKRGLERNIENPGRLARHYNKGRTGFFFADAGVWQAIPEYEEFLFESGVAGAAGGLMGANKINLFFDNMFMKDRGTPDPTPWHHDMPYMPIEGDQVISLWVALDPVPRATSVEYIAGSHRWGRQFRPRSFFDPEADYDESGFLDDRLEPIPDFESERDKHRILGWEMAPGDIQAFHGFTVHGAPGNPNPNPRRAFVSRWTGDDIRYAWKGEETYPTFPDCGLEAGDPIGGPSFPLVWTKDGGLVEKETAA